MATMYVAWHKWNRVPVNGTTMQTEGQFIASQAVDITASAPTDPAPVDAEYAEVWADVPFYFVPGTGSVTATKDKACKPFPANVPVQVTPIRAGGTKIAGIAI